MKSNEQPIFRQIIERINAGIDSGEFARGDAIPSEPELCRQFSTTRMTVRRAIDALVNEGKLFRVQGKGTFVSHFELDKTYQKLGFTSNMLSLGVHPSSMVILAGPCEAGEEVLSSLEMAEDEPVFCLQRIRMADESPIAIERVWISLKRFPRLPEFDFSQRSLYEVLHQESGLDLANGYSRQRINAVSVSGEDAQALFHAKKGVALRIRNVDYDKAHRPFAMADTLYHGGKYTLDVVI
ncbi:MAG: GntR family transcriptional regulator [Eubacteriales bacterium]|jgi:GntR family transcriptional regulator|nr:GntR family transcriptional regulator [Eubacteriales bacterium]